MPDHPFCKATTGGTARSVGSRLLASLAIAGGVAALGYRARALSADGAVAATAVGGALLARRDVRSIAALAVFFVSGSALSRLHEPSDVVERGSQRTAQQVLANGGIAGLCAAFARRSDTRMAAAARGALAAAAADTWATEIGRLSATPPRMLLAGTMATPGTSGAVTALGMLGSLAGACAIAAIELPTHATGQRRALAAGAAGTAGALADTLLGELVQERRWCPACDAATEAPVHACGAATTHVGGVAGVTNDVVNLLCTAVGAGVAALLSSGAATLRDG